MSDSSIRLELTRYDGVKAANAYLRLNNDDFMSVEVELYDLPWDEANPIGHEVTVNFWAPEIDNDGVFYTDSNGLEMQKRVQNHRDTWDLELPTMENITANYYPIQTAISMSDLTTGKSMIVMNSQSQGGSACIVPGRIELMQNRRMFVDDDKGVGECLNETDASGTGITTFGTYYVRVFNSTT